MKPRKYRKGRAIITFEGLLINLEKIGFVYLRDKIQHKGWVMSLQFRYLANLMDKDLIFRAVKNKKEI